MSNQVQSFKRGQLGPYIQKPKTLVCPRDAAERAVGKGKEDFKKRAVKITSYIWNGASSLQEPSQVEEWDFLTQVTRARCRPRDSQRRSLRRGVRAWLCLGTAIPPNRNSYPGGGCGKENESAGGRGFNDCLSFVYHNIILHLSRDRPVILKHYIDNESFMEESCSGREPRGNQGRPGAKPYRGEPTEQQAATG